jgi:hypothetical protein
VKKVFRLHYAINICNLSSEQYKLTTEKTGESLTNFSIKPNQLIMADRGYCSKIGIENLYSAMKNTVFPPDFRVFQLNKPIIRLQNTKIRRKNCSALRYFHY